jgi:hypothetical protein
VKHVETVLAYSDVRSALARAPVVFGRDVRAAGRSVLRISVDGKEVVVGEACDSDPTCSPPPAGVAQLASELAHAHVVTDDTDCAVP